MDPNESQHHHPHPLSYLATPTTTATSSPTNGLLPPSNTATTTSAINNNSNNTSTETGTGGAPILYPHSVGPSSAAVTSAPVEHPPRRNRGRPRKYGTPEQALAARKTAAASNSASKDKREAAASSSSYSASSKRSHQLLALGNAGQGFSPHVISVTAGEDVGQKLMMFMQQSKRDMCILSASGSISNASLRQPAMSGGNIAYEGRFEIISLSGSYIRTDLGGRTGGLSVCLSNTDGQIIGGGVGGPLKAAGPVQVFA
uniref:AT-hook motif nuclear-localized protein n=1 Tax=Rhizophora mucronata TaxID=61149 RepID=A0A2P2KK79_RHIMU